MAASIQREAARLEVLVNSVIKALEGEPSGGVAAQDTPADTTQEMPADAAQATLADAAQATPAVGKVIWLSDKDASSLSDSEIEDCSKDDFCNNFDFGSDIECLGTTAAPTKPEPDAKPFTATSGASGKDDNSDGNSDDELTLKGLYLKVK